MVAQAVVSEFLEEVFRYGTSIINKREQIDNDRKDGKEGGLETLLGAVALGVAADLTAEIIGNIPAAESYRRNECNGDLLYHQIPEYVSALIYGDPQKYKTDTSGYKIVHSVLTTGAKVFRGDRWDNSKIGGGIYNTLETITKPFNNMYERMFGKRKLSST